MQQSDGAEFGYRIRRALTGWSWVVFDRDGAVAVSGTADDRAVAAACVIRAIARGECRTAAA